MKENGINISELSRQTGVPYHLLHYRIAIKKWPVEKAISQPRDERYTSRRNKSNTMNRFDVGLDTLLEERAQGECFTRDDIATVCGVTYECIRQLEEKAKHLLARRLMSAYRLTWDDIIRDGVNNFL